MQGCRGVVGDRALVDFDCDLDPEISRHSARFTQVLGSGDKVLL
jgi:hypothetical protein